MCRFNSEAEQKYYCHYKLKIVHSLCSDLNTNSLTQDIFKNTKQKMKERKEKKSYILLYDVRFNHTREVARHDNKFPGLSVHLGASRVPEPSLFVIHNKRKVII